MAQQVLTKGYVKLGANDISANVQQVTMTYEADAVANDNMGADTHVFLPGLKNWSLSIQLTNDFAAGALDSILFPLVGTSFTVEVRPSNAARGASNPAYVADGLLKTYPPIGAKVGAIAGSTIQIVPSGETGHAPTMTRLTA